VRFSCSSNMIRSMRRDAVEELFRHVPVRIDKAHSPPLVDILKDEVPKQGTFSGTGLADHVHMPSSLGSGDLDGLVIAPIYSRANNAHTTPYPLTASCCAKRAMRMMRGRSGSNWGHTKTQKIIKLYTLLLRIHVRISTHER
jgi:hypothetical protein